MLKLAEESLGFAKEVLKFVNEKQRTRYQQKYYKLLKDLNRAKNRWVDYNDIDIAVLNSEIAIFIEAFKNELKDS